MFEDTLASRLMSYRCCIVAAGLIGLSTLCGCFQKASVGVWQASTTSLPGAGRVGLVGVEEDRQGLVSRLLSDRLDSYANWSIVDVESIQPIQLVSAEESPSIGDLIEAADEAGVGLLISGSVRDAEIVRPAAWNPFDDETVAKVSLQLAAYSTSGDEARVSETITKTVPVPAGTDQLSEAVFRSLAAQAVDDFLAQFQPKSGSLTLNLAKPTMIDPARRLVRQGNIAAAKGQWSIAAEYYREAVQRNPECDQALFNLSLAAVTDRRFDEAESLALQALHLRHDAVYVDGLSAIQELAEEDRKVRYQTGER